MYRIILATEAPLLAGDLRADLVEIGIEISTDIADPSELVQAAVRVAPDLVVAASISPSAALFDAARILNTLEPCPFVVFTSDGDAGKITRAAGSGIHAYVVNGYAKHRLLSVIQVGRARFRQEQELKGELSGLSRRLEERKLVDRAKASLMRSRGVSEEEAFGLLRTLAMRSRQRIGVAAQSVIDMSRAGEAVNRAGQLRMLSQRIVKCYAQHLAGFDPGTALQNISDCVARVDTNLSILRKAISAEGYGTLVERVADSWRGVLDVFSAAPSPDRLVRLDACAEALLRDAESLAKFLESSGLVTSLQILNVSGRQRMLTQRIAKLCCFLALAPEPGQVTQLRELTAAFGSALTYLRGAPLASTEIIASVDTVMAEWSRLETHLAAIGTASALAEILDASERLLDASERLTGHYENAMQILIGQRIGQIG